MARIERERRFTVVQSPDWQPPENFESAQGVLVARLGCGEIGLYMNGRWRRYKLVEWQLAFDTQLPPSVRNGEWAILPRLHQRGLGTYQDSFSAVQLGVALNRAPNQLLKIVKRQPVEHGHRVGDRATVFA